MKKFLLIGIATLSVLGTAVAPAMAAKPKPDPNVVITKACPAADKQKTYTGNVIVIVKDKGCVSVDDGATAIASGNAVVAAHGKSVVRATGNVILIVFNERVACSISSSVTLINASKFRDSYIRCQRPKSK